MGLAIWKRQPEEQCIHAQHFFECLRDWNAASLADERNRLVERFCKGSLRRFSKRRVGPHNVWPARMLIDNFDFNRIGTFLFQEVRYCRSQFLRILIWHQSE